MGKKKKREDDTDSDDDEMATIVGGGLTGLGLAGLLAWYAGRTAAAEVKQNNQTCLDRLIADMQNENGKPQQEHVSSQAWLLGQSYATVRRLESKKKENVTQEDKDALAHSEGVIANAELGRLGEAPMIGSLIGCFQNHPPKP